MFEISHDRFFQRVRCNTELRRQSQYRVLLGNASKLYPQDDPRLACKIDETVRQSSMVIKHLLEKSAVATTAVHVMIPEVKP